MFLILRKWGKSSGERIGLHSSESVTKKFKPLASWIIGDWPKEFLEDVVDYNDGSNVIPLGYSCWNNLFEIRYIPF